MKRNPEYSREEAFFLLLKARNALYQAHSLVEKVFPHDMDVEILWSNKLMDLILDLDCDSFDMTQLFKKVDPNNKVDMNVVVEMEKAAGLLSYDMGIDKYLN